MHQLGKKISQLRKLNKLTQKEFAKLAEITYRHYQNIEADKANIRLSTAADIASSLMIPLQTLFDQNHSIELLGTGLKDAWQILDLSPVGVCISNLEGRIIYLNSYFNKNLVDQPHDRNPKNLFVWDLLPPQKKSDGKLDFLRVIRERTKPKPGKRTYLGPGKKEIEVMIYWDYIYDDLKNPKGFVSAVVPLD